MIFIIAQLKPNTYIDSSKEINNKYPKSKIVDIFRISQNKNFFAKGYTPYWTEKSFVIKKVKNTVPWTYIIHYFNGDETVGTFHEKELEKTNQKEFTIEKVIIREGDKVYVKWKGYDNLFKSWIDKKGIV